MVMHDHYFLHKFFVSFSNDIHIITTIDIRKCCAFIPTFK